MHDPFPFPPPPLLARLTTPIANALALPTLPLHIHELLVATLVYHIICRYISPYLSSKLFPRTYPTLNARTKLNWDVHVVSLAQSLIINTLALWVMWTDEERGRMEWEERVWGYTGASGMIQGFAAGYFLWDLITCAGNVAVFGWGLLAHAVAALVVFSLGFVSRTLIRVEYLLGLQGVSMTDTSTTETVCQLLRPHIHPLRALLPVPQFPLVLR